MNARTTPGGTVEHLITRALDDHRDLNPDTVFGPTIADLQAAVAHINEKTTWWREAAVYLAAQLHATKRTADRARFADAELAMHQAAKAIRAYEDRHGRLA